MHARRAHRGEKAQDILPRDVAQEWLVSGRDLVLTVNFRFNAQWAQKEVPLYGPLFPPNAGGLRPRVPAFQRSAFSFQGGVPGRRLVRLTI